jgi:hypothetical protein
MIIIILMKLEALPCVVYIINHRLLSRKLKFQKTLPIKTFPNTNKIRMQRPNLYPRKFSREKSINGTVQAGFSLKFNF